MRRQTLNDFRAERDALFCDLTLEAATAYWESYDFPTPDDPLLPLAIVHKARLHWLEATDAMLAESLQWLKDHDYKTKLRGGAPLTPITRDFERMRQGKPPLMRP